MLEHFSAENQAEKQQPGLLNSPATAFVNLNDLVHQVMQPYQAQIRKGMLAFRCEHLPVVEGDYSKIFQIFQSLICLALDQQSQQQRYFHIACKESSQGGVTDLRLKQGFAFYSIHFKSNVKCGAGNDNLVMQLQQSRRLLQALKGEAELQEATAEGCLFSILLPGKMQAYGGH